MVERSSEPPARGHVATVGAPEPEGFASETWMRFVSGLHAVCRQPLCSEGAREMAASWYVPDQQRAPLPGRSP